MPQKNLFRNIGERPESNKSYYMIVKVGVTVEWPDGIPFDEEACKGIAESATPQSWDADVGIPGKIVWANCKSECIGEAVVVKSEEI